MMLASRQGPSIFAGLIRKAVLSTSTRLPAFLHAFGEVLQPALKLAGRHFGGGIEPAQLDQVGGWAIEYLAPSVLIDLFSHSLTSSQVRRVRYRASCLSRRASSDAGRPTRPSPPRNARRVAIR